MSVGQELVLGISGAHNTRCAENRSERPLIPVLGFGSLLLADPTVDPRLQIPTFSTAKLFNWFKDHRQKGKINRCSHSVFEEDTQNKFAPELV